MPPKPFAISASRLGTYAWCPAAYRDRYILRLPEPPSVEMHFGLAVHKGLELAYRGEDGQAAFVRDWSTRRTEIQAQNIAVPDLTQRGMHLVAAALSLGWAGQPERSFALDFPAHNIGAIGYIDLWGDGFVADWKTTMGKWGQARADKEIFQPALYSLAYFNETGELPEFRYVILSRQPGVPVQVLDGSRTQEQMMRAFDTMARIYDAIQAGIFACSCGKHQEQVA